MWLTSPKILTREYLADLLPSFGTKTEEMKTNVEDNMAVN